MKTIKAIIKLFGNLNDFPAIHIDNDPFMRLCIERIGVGPRGLPMISVAHYYEQSGDLMRDPDVVFEVDAEGNFHPVSFQMDNPPSYHRACYKDERGHVMVNTYWTKDLKKFARMWDKNIKEQGFLQAARLQAAKKEVQS